MPELNLPEDFETFPEARKKSFLRLKELKDQGRPHQNLSPPQMLLLLACAVSVKN